MKYVRRKVFPRFPIPYLPLENILYSDIKTKLIPSQFLCFTFKLIPYVLLFNSYLIRIKQVCNFKIIQIHFAES